MSHACSQEEFPSGHRCNFNTKFCGIPCIFLTKKPCFLALLNYSEDQVPAPSNRENPPSIISAHKRSYPWKADAVIFPELTQEKGAMEQGIIKCYAAGKKRMQAIKHIFMRLQSNPTGSPWSCLSCATRRFCSGCHLWHWCQIRPNWRQPRTKNYVRAQSAFMAIKKIS